MIARYLHSIDLGETTDYTAHSILEQGPLRPPVERWSDPLPEYHVTHLERYQHRPYPDIVRSVSQMLRGPICAGESALILDITGVGRPVWQMFREALGDLAGWLTIIPITITGSGKAHPDGGSLHVPKQLLANTVAAILHQDRLVFAKELLEAKTARSELGAFRVKYTEHGNVGFSAREGKHDDVVLSVAMGLYVAELYRDVHAGVLRVVYE